MKYLIDKIHDYRCTFTVTGHLKISVGMWRSTCMSRSLTCGLAVMVRRIGHCDHRTSPSPQISCLELMKSMASKRKVNRREELCHRTCNVARLTNDPDALCSPKVQIILIFKCP